MFFPPGGSLKVKCPCRAWQGAPAEESQVPGAEQKKSEIIKVLFAPLLPGVAVVELLNQLTPDHVSDLCLHAQLLAHRKEQRKGYR